MRSVRVRDVQHHLSDVLRKVEQGETIGVTKRGRIVARIVPVQQRPTRVRWPDFMARLERLFPARGPRGKSPSEIIAEMRQDRI